MNEFPPSVQKKLRYYVYVYLDPRDGEVFYVGKGNGNRAFAHLLEGAGSAKTKRIRAIRREGGEPAIEVLAHGLDEPTAFKLEAAAIDLLGRHKLTNLVRGLGSAIAGRMTVLQLNALYAPKPAVFKHSAVLIRINKLFRYGMTEIELYDATRGVWRLNPEAAAERLAMPVFDRVIQEVYEVEQWLPAGSTLSTRGRLRSRGRYEFVGRIAISSIRDHYRYKSVDSRLSPGNQNPLRYVEPGAR
ncbi:MAG: hypothetical protein ABI651_05890 [Verrucomicrobiota bacterium]